MMTTSLAAIVGVLAAAVLGAVGQYLFQHGAVVGRSGVQGFVANPFFLLGMAVYVAVMVLFTAAFKAGGSVRVLYPLYASTFIWAALIAWWRFGDAVQPVHGIGMALLIIGIVCMSW